MPTRRNKDKWRSTRTRSLKLRLPKLRRIDKMRSNFPRLELSNSNSSKRRRLPKNSKPRRWSKSSLLLKPSKRPRLPPPRKLLPRPTSPD